MTRGRLERRDVELLVAAGVAIAIGLGLLAAGAGTAGAGLITLTAAVLAALRPTAALVVVIIAFPVHPLAMRIAQVDLGTAGSALILLSAWKEVAVGVAIARLALDRVRDRKPPPRGPSSRPLLGDILAAALVVIVLLALVPIAAGIVDVPIGLVVNQARLLLFPVAVYIGLRLMPRLPTQLLPAVVASAAVVAVFGIIQGSALGWGWVERYFGTADQPIPYTFVASNLIGPRASGTLSSPNELALFLAVGITAVLAMMLFRPSTARSRVVLGGVLVLLVVASGLTFSRSTIIGIGLGSLLLLAMAPWRTAGGRMALLAVAVALVPAVGVTGAAYQGRGGLDLIRGTVSTIGGDERPPPTPRPTGGPSGAPQESSAPGLDPSTEVHLSSLSSGARLLGDHPLGTGLGSVGARVVPGTGERPTYIVESWFLSMGLALGWLGLGWAVAFTIALLIAGLRGRGSGRAAAGFAVASGVVGFFLPTLLEPQLASLAWVLLALAEASRRSSAAG